MPVLRANGRVVFFSHVPKTGGTSVEAYMRAKGPVALYTENRAAEGLRATPQHLHRAVIDAMVPEGFFDASFAILRDPMARLMSEYRWRASRRGYVIQRDPPRVTKMLRKVSKRLGRKRLVFDEWVALTLDGYGRDPWIYDNHIRPQTEFVAEGDTLFRFEDGLEPVYRWIDGATATDPAEGTFWFKKTEGRLEITPSETTRARVRAFYAADYELWARLGRGGSES
ncbi:Sulfotransferase family protein [Roseivivax jejudonensis]|uniref:Sulfotransferase family protein n=1 Tax=Roseivivax jejudonensis TaxID=1529041 RepID=A0A1X6Z2D7_9RHOB|nr:sulfotransferase family 2 domain-containing protein [Roseivivax jejudonensis]SLN38471.1 Sulfotransferase family protein [Roseivivax jejudonensis]